MDVRFRLLNTDSKFDVSRFLIIIKYLHISNIFFIKMLVTFLLRIDPASKQAKPHCITRKKRRKMLLQKKLQIFLKVVILFIKKKKKIFEFFYLNKFLLALFHPPPILKIIFRCQKKKRNKYSN